MRPAKTTTLLCYGMAAILSQPALSAADVRSKRLILPGMEAQRRAKAASKARASNVETLDYPEPNEFSQALAVNNSRDVAGIWGDMESATHGYFYSNGQYTRIDYPGAFNTIATGIANNGTIVGSWSDLAGNSGNFLFRNGQFTPIDLPPAPYAETYGINDSGTVIGTFFPDEQGFEGFVWSRGVFTPIKVPGSTDTFPTAINNNGQIVGGYYAKGDVHGFLFSQGVFTTIDAPGADATWITGVNSAGDMVGQIQYGIPDLHVRPFARSFFELQHSECGLREHRRNQRSRRSGWRLRAAHHKGDGFSAASIKQRRSMQAASPDHSDSLASVPKWKGSSR